MTCPARNLFNSECDNRGARFRHIEEQAGYKGYVIEARSYQQQDGGFSAELWIEEHDASGVTETQFYLPATFPTQELAIEAALQAGRRKIDAGFERGSADVNG